MTAVRRSRRSLAVWASFSVSFVCAACTTTPEADPFLAPVDGGSQRTRVDLGAARHAERPAPTIVPAAYEVPANESVRSQSPSEFEPAGFTPPTAGPINGAIPRDWTLNCPPPGYGAPGLAHPLASSPALHPDEYLLDGGDRDHPVHYDSFNRLGLDTEDTVAEYVDEDGNRFTKPTNRVAVYAPRFAAVRSVDMPGQEQLVLEPGLHRVRRGEIAINTRLVAVAHQKTDPPLGLRGQSRASEVDTDVRGAGVDQVGVLAVHEKLINLGENVTFLRTGILEQEDRPIIAQRIEAAAAWTGDTRPVAHVKLDGAHEVTVQFRASQSIGIDESNRKPANLRIVKLADKDHAQRGEIVTFTIRYDNLGDEPVHHLRIVDNLTPRLEYVDDSADSDRVGQLVVQDNGEGSLVMIFELGEPIEGGTGGVVSFQTRVR